MYRLNQFIAVCTVVLFFIGCAGQAVRKDRQAMAPGGEGVRGSAQTEQGPESQHGETFYHRNRGILRDVFIATLVVTEIALFWYLADKYHDSDGVFLWVGPLWPWCY